MGSLLSWLKVALLTSIVVLSFIFSSLGWRHIQTDETTRVVVSAVILLSMYGLMVFELVNRNLAALIGAAVSVAAYDCLVEHVNMEQILQWEDLETLSLLFGMMIIVNVLGCSGLFDFLAIWSYKRAAGHFWFLIVIMSIITGVLSAFIDNVSTMLLISPTLIRLSELEHIDPRYMLMIMVIVCNIGGSATPVGDPPNLIIIGNPLIGELGITFGSFVAYCGPCVLLTVGIILTHLRLFYKSKDSFRLVADCQEPELGLDTISTSSSLGRYQASTRQRAPGDNSSEQQQIDDLKRDLALVIEKRPIMMLDESNKQKLMQGIEERVSEVMTSLTGQNGDSSNVSKSQALGLPDLNEDHLMSRSRLSSRLSDGAIKQMMVTYSIKSSIILTQSLSVLVAAVMLFLIQSLPGTNLTLGWISLFAGLTLMVLSSNVRISTREVKENSLSMSHHGDEEAPDEEKEEQRGNFEHVINNIEWSTLMFFFALFIVMEVMTKLGLIRFVGQQITSLVDQLPDGHWREIGGITIILWSSGIASALIDNVPFTSMMIKVLGAMAGSPSARTAVNTLDMRPLVFALVFGACYGGNATLIGASANLVTTGVATRHGYPISFNSFAKFSMLPTFISLVVANLYLVIVFVFLRL